MKKNIKVTAAILVTAAAAGTGGAAVGASVWGGESGASSPALSESGSDSGTQNVSEEDLNKISSVYDLIDSEYMTEVDDDALVQGAIEGMIGELDDPHSSYMSESTAQEFTQSLDSSFEGIGAEVNKSGDAVTIVSPIDDSPAEAAGLQPNDDILEINGESTENLELNEAVLKIRGEKGTNVNLTVQRGSGEPFNVEVERDEIPIETVESEVIEQDGESIGYLNVSSFSENTANEFETQLEQVESENIDGLVIDVRGNPGGYLNAVEDIGSMIIPGGEPVVEIEDREGTISEVTSSLEENKDYPVVGVIDQGSVSASEILAGAMKESGNFELVGQTTYGKGTVQQVMELDDGSDVKLSVSKWLTPDGNWINEEGVEPTIEQEQPDYFQASILSIDEALEPDTTGENIATAQTLLKGAGFDPGREDGYYSEETEAAVQDFQEEQEGLEATGTLTPETADALNDFVLENVQNRDNDKQLQRALDTVVEQ